MKIEQIFRREMKNTLGEHISFGNSEEDITIRPKYNIMNDITL